MKTQSLLAQAFGMFINRQTATTRRKGMMRVVASLFTLAVLGFNSPAYAGWVTIFSDRVGYVSSTPDATTLVMPEGYDNTCGGRDLIVPYNSPLHDRAFVVFNSEFLTDRKLEVRVDCDGIHATVNLGCLKTPFFGNIIFPVFGPRQYRSKSWI